MKVKEFKEVINNGGEIIIDGINYKVLEGAEWVYCSDSLQPDNWVSILAEGPGGEIVELYYFVSDDLFESHEADTLEFVDYDNPEYIDIVEEAE